MPTPVFAALSAARTTIVAGPAENLAVLIITAAGVLIFGVILLLVTIRSRRHLE